MKTDLVFSILEDKQEIQRVQNIFSRKLKSFASTSGQLFLGMPGASFFHKVFWFEKEGIWWGYYPPSGKKFQRHWNAFGISHNEPQWNNKKSLNVTAEINVAKKGVRGNAGYFLKDMNDNYYIAHTGRIYSKKGIGKKEFVENYSSTHSWNEVNTSKKPKNMSIISSLNDENLISNLGLFVNEVDRIKNSIYIKHSKISKHSDKFKDEFSGSKNYTVNQKVESDSKHGRLINQMKKIIESRGFTCSNVPIDLNIYGTNDKSIFIEAKTSNDTTDRYGAIGQLFYYSLKFRQNKKTRLVAVFPNPINSEFKKILEKLGIFYVGYHWKNNVLNLDRNFNNILNYLK